MECVVVEGGVKGVRRGSLCRVVVASVGQTYIRGSRAHQEI